MRLVDPYSCPRSGLTGVTAVTSVTGITPYRV